MPVVPFAPQASQTSPRQQPSAEPTYLAIAAAQMHADSRLFASDSAPPTKEEPNG